MSMMSELTFFLGLQVRHLETGIFINQAKYTKELLKKFGLENCSTASTPMNSSSKLDKDEGGQNVYIIAYRGIIDSLLYLTTSRPNILFGVGYPIDSSFNLISYSSVHYAACKIDRKSTSGMCQFLGDRLISWFSKKQASITMSIVDVEYLAVGSCCAQLMWIQQ
ncbi:uncharacterized mitochondrial protein AtMg00810-like [Impatiens glandulifera]|uniref:uncharacterized mitochondrial protein AtMg00810-like n=1 Tax=Impatiens glandulifera TaxID=253017 RepID=UPI001FB19726|nr:uncharacterized mitochondrial protein AtMg00810-like [Impatiens glandulifera]